MQLRLHPLVFFTTTLLIALTARTGLAFSVIGVKNGSFVDYSKNGIEGSVNTFDIQELLPPKEDDDFMETLTNAFKQKDGWKFKPATSQLNGSFNILHYYPCEPQTECGREHPFPDGTPITVTGNVGAFLDLKYEPKGNDPKGDKVHWIQRITTDYKSQQLYGSVQYYIDNPAQETPIDTPYYDEGGFAGSDFFVDKPYRSYRLSSFWIGELYLVEVADSTKPQEVTIHSGIRWAWRNLVKPPQPTKTFSGTLTSGSQTDKFTLNNLTPGSYFYTWTNNNIPSNRCNPNTYLSATSGNGYNYDDDSSLVGDGFASALSGIVPDNGIIDLFVRAANGGRRGEDKGSYELNVKVYDDEAAPSHIINGGSGGGGVSRPRPGNTQQNPVLPNGTGGGWQVFSNVPGCRWYDPHTPYGFEFQALEDTLFTSILDFPVGIDNRFTISVGDTILGEFGPGDSVDFVSLLGQAVDNFKITGIDSLIGDTEETAFPIQLAFNKQQGSFKMRSFHEDETPAPKQVPESISALGLLALSVWGYFQALKIKKDSQEP